MAQSITTAPPAPTANDMAVIWRPCWHCALPLTDDEHDLCDPCHDQLHPFGLGLYCWGEGDTDRPPITYVMRLGDDQVADMLAAAIEHEMDRLIDAAGEWAYDHDLEPDETAAYKLAVIEGASTRLRRLGQLEARTISAMRTRRSVQWVARHCGSSA